MGGYFPKCFFMVFISTRSRGADETEAGPAEHAGLASSLMPDDHETEPHAGKAGSLSLTSSEQMLISTACLRVCTWARKGRLRPEQGHAPDLCCRKQNVRCFKIRSISCIRSG